MKRERAKLRSYFDGLVSSESRTTHTINVSELSLLLRALDVPTFRVKQLVDARSNTQGASDRVTFEEFCSLVTRARARHHPASATGPGGRQQRLPNPEYPMLLLLESHRVRDAVMSYQQVEEKSATEKARSLRAMINRLCMPLRATPREARVRAASGAAAASQPPRKAVTSTASNPYRPVPRRGPDSAKAALVPRRRASWGPETTARDLLTKSASVPSARHEEITPTWT